MGRLKISNGGSLIQKLHTYLKGPISIFILCLQLDLVMSQYDDPHRLVPRLRPLQIEQEIAPQAEPPHGATWNKIMVIKINYWKVFQIISLISYISYENILNKIILIIKTALTPTKEIKWKTRIMKPCGLEKEGYFRNHVVRWYASWWWNNTQNKSSE